MLTISSISIALASTTADPTMIYVIIGVVVLVFLILASAGTSAPTRRKQYCPYCRRQINYSVPLNTPQRRHPVSAHNQAHNRLLANRPGQIPRSHNRTESVPVPPVQRRGGNIYCPYCQGKL
jgi:hypothetical protein